MSLLVELIPALRDNYIYLLRDQGTAKTAVVDPSLAAPVVQALSAHGWRLDYILNTHHHFDHTGGNLELKEFYGATVVGPKADRDRIPGIDVDLADDEKFHFGSRTARVIDIPGHTRGHIAFWFKADAALFCGDTLFAMGCGRMFEGTPEQMWTSLSKLAALPKPTRIYCGHEYTEANARFALTLEPGNRPLRERADGVAKLRAQGLPTLPSTLGEELLTNPFLRPQSPEIQASVGLAGQGAVAVFAEVRRLKDQF
jgi:hydroxyacylglutathione hydrolase